MAFNCGLPWPPLRKHTQTDKSKFERYSHGLPQWEATVGGHSGRPQWEATVGRYSRVATVGGHSWTVFPHTISNFNLQFTIFNFPFVIFNLQFTIFNFQISILVYSIFGVLFSNFNFQKAENQESKSQKLRDQ